MAQYIDTSLINENDFWDASSWRRMCREMSGIRGIAPAIHIHNNTNDSNSSQNVKDDRIFRIHTHSRIYVWGVEMYAGGYDTVKIYWRSDPPDADWNLDENWKLIKGAGIFFEDQFFIDVNDSSTNKGTPENELDISEMGLHFPQSNPLPDGTEHNPDPPFSVDNKDFYKNWLVEVKHSGFMQGKVAGPNPKLDSNGRAYHTLSSNFLRTFIFLKEGYWKIVLDETMSPYYNENIESPKSSNIDLNWFETEARMSPVVYENNLNMYGSLPGQVDYDKNLAVEKTGKRYRSCFTREINIQSFYPDKDLINGAIFSRTFKTMDPGKIVSEPLVSEPYVKVTGYGSQWEKDSSNNNKFIKTKNSSSQDGTQGYPYTTEIFEYERSSNFEWRYTPEFKKQVINRRHLFLDGVSIISNQDAVEFWENEPTFVHPNEAVNNFKNFPGLSKGWIVDFRGSIFKNCIFKNIIIGNSPYSNWSGCSFVNCKFYNCCVSVNGDSILFDNCYFEGGAPNNLDVFNSCSFTSSAVISSQFININRPFIFTANKGPISDNLIWRNVFDDNSLQSNESEMFVVEFPKDLREDAQKYCFINNSKFNIKYISQQNEFARNIYAYNRTLHSNRGMIGPDQCFARANFYYANGFYDGLKISGNLSENDEDKFLYDSWAHNFIHKIYINIPEKTYHFRFLLNAVAMPNLYDDKNINNQYNRFAGEEKAWITATDSNIESPWYCISSTSMGNKILKNNIINWADYFSKHPKGPCSCFLNFHHVYDPDFNINSSYDSYWSVNNRWKYVNIAHRNIFSFPQVIRNAITSDGEIGRLMADGKPWKEKNESAIKIIMPLEFPIIGSNSLDESQTSFGYKCSQDENDKNDRNLCRAIYVKNVSNGNWELKNDGSTMWASQIFRPQGSIP